MAERAAENYFVDEDALRSRRFRAAIKGVLPSAEVYVQYVLSRKTETTYNFELLNGETPWIDRLAEGAIVDARLSAVWELPRIVFNTEELDVYRLAHIKRRVTDHALQTHFSLRALNARAEGKSVGDVERVLTALDREQLQKTLDALTGDQTGAP